MKRLAAFALLLALGCDKPPPAPAPSAPPAGKGEIRPGVFVPWAVPGRSVDDWIRDLREGDEHQRLQARFNLALLKGEAVPRLVEMLRSADRTVRLRGAWALAAIGRPAVAALDALIAALSDPDREVAQQAAAAFPALGPAAARAAPAAVRALLGGLVDVNLGLTTALVRDFGRAGEDALVEALRSDNLERVLWLFRCLDGEMVGTDDFAVWLLARALRSHEDPLARWCAAEVLGRLGRDTALAHRALVQALLEDVDPRVRCECARVLGRLAADDDDLRETALPALREAARDTDRAVARSAGNAALLAQGTAVLIPPEREAAKRDQATHLETDGDVREALELLQELLDLLGDDPESRRWREALRRLDLR